MRPGSPGNSELGPERGVEVEAGFDATFFDGRVSIDFTYYDQTTKDAIVARNVPPSTGFTSARFVNIGEINNRGIELGLNARILESEALDWDFFVNASTNRNRIVDLGLPCSGKPELRDTCFLQLGWTTRHHEGYPVGSLFAPSVAFAEFLPGLRPDQPRDPPLPFSRRGRQRPVHPVQRGGVDLPGPSGPEPGDFRGVVVHDRRAADRRRPGSGQDRPDQVRPAGLVEVRRHPAERTQRLPA